MTNQQWLAKVRDNQEVLTELIRGYHPAAHSRRRSLPITAPGAEAACEVVRRKIAKEEAGDPVVQFKAAMNTGNLSEISRLLDGAWFGVPESTSCWQIPGFALAVDLMEDPPEDEEETEGKVVEADEPAF